MKVPFPVDSCRHSAEKDIEMSEPVCMSVGCCCQARVDQLDYTNLEITKGCQRQRTGDDAKIGREKENVWAIVVFRESVNWHLSY